MSNAVQKKALSAKAVISWAVTILVPVVLLLIPTSETYTSQLRIFFALTICAILMFAFDQVHSAIPALLLPLAYALTGLVPFGTAMAPWTQPVVWIVFGCFLIAAIYDRVGILRRVAYWAIVRTGATYKGIIYGFFLAGLILNLLVPSAWVCMVFLALGRSICEAFRLGKSRAACGIYMSAILGYMEAQLFVYAPTQVGVALGAAGIQVSYFDFLKQNIALVPLFVILCLMIPRLMKPEQEINGRVYFQAEYEKLGRMTGDEIKCLVVALLLIVFLFTTQFHGLDPVYGFLVAPAILFFPGMRVAKKEDFAGVNLSTLVFGRMHGHRQRGQRGGRGAVHRQCPDPHPVQHRRLRLYPAVLRIRLCHQLRPDPAGRHDRPLGAAGGHRQRPGRQPGPGALLLCAGPGQSAAAL